MDSEWSSSAVSGLEMLLKHTKSVWPRDLSSGNPTSRSDVSFSHLQTSMIPVNTTARLCILSLCVVARASTPSLLWTRRAVDLFLQTGIALNCPWGPRHFFFFWIPYLSSIRHRYFINRLPASSPSNPSGEAFLFLSLVVRDSIDCLIFFAVNPRYNVQDFAR